MSKGDDKLKTLDDQIEENDAKENIFGNDDDDKDKENYKDQIKDKEEPKEKLIEQKPLQPKRGGKRRPSLYGGFDDGQKLFRPEYQFDNKDQKKSKMWELMDIYLPRDRLSVQKSIVTHIEYTLSTTRFDINDNYVFQGTALSVRDRLLEEWNDTQLYIKINNPKKIYYMSIEFLLGRLLQNALVNIDLEKCYKDALSEFGYKIEDVFEKENDPALGNGGLGRLAACYIDSLATLNYPAWGYGIRYDYGIFKQVIENFQQKELPDYWLTKGNPWEIMRLDTKFNVRFYGYVKDIVINKKKYRSWEGGDEVVALAYDTAVPGFNTFNCNTLRLWKSFPSEEFDFESFNKGNYQSALEEKDQASYITSVLYPNDSTLSGKELRLKQEFFFSSATVQNVIRRFKRLQLPWSQFPETNVIQLNDTHPTLAIIELFRILIDDEKLEEYDAFDIILRTFNYTNHTVLPEALEKWSIDIFGKILPRHLELIYLINFHLMDAGKRTYPNNLEKLSPISIVEESYPKQLRMANLCIVCSSHVNGVAEIHSNLLKTHLFKHFYDFYNAYRVENTPKGMFRFKIQTNYSQPKFLNVTNGVTPRRWIHCAFPELSNLLTEYNKGENDWLAELTLLYEIQENLQNENKLDEFMEKFKKAKIAAKIRMKNLVKISTGYDISETFMFDVMVKRIHEYKRQLMNALYCIYRYFQLKKCSAEERKKWIKRVTFFGGKAAPGYVTAKNYIRLINMISNVINNDQDVNDYYKVIYLPDYKVSSAQIIIPSADLSQHISTAGTEASGTSCMKFAMTGSLIIGTRDGANIEIAKEIGEDNIFYFGADVNQVEKARNDSKNDKHNYVSPILKELFNSILNNRFGDTSFMHDYIKSLMYGRDYYLICQDFNAYLEAQEKVDKTYANFDDWNKKCIHSIFNMGFFSSDRSIETYAKDIWDAKPIEVPKPSLDRGSHFVSQENLREKKK